ncbi:MAG: SpoIID/LytB domain-containing protein [Lachnospiraceae bacterium]|nr:SpoIID/LytB domain-containing protein [Lachnospiraceae bacterium]
MKYDSKLLIKLSLIFFGILFLVCVWLGRKHADREAPRGEKITLEDVRILMDALGADCNIGTKQDEEYSDDGQETSSLDGRANLTYAQYITLYEQIDGSAFDIPDFAGSYEREDEMLKTDWYTAFRVMAAHLDQEHSLWETTVFVLKVDADKKEAYTENGAMQGAYSYCSAAFEENVFQEMKVYVQGNKLLTIVEVLPEEHYLGNVWVMESTGNALECFYRQVPFTAVIADAGHKLPERETIADLTFEDGKITGMREKSDKVHGKLLRVGDGEMEIEGCGVYKIADGMEIYKLYGSLETLQRNDLKIGYADSDFVIDKDKVCACLVSRDETADTIRVLLKNTAQNSNYHEEIKLVIDGEAVCVKAKDLEIGERKIYQSANLTDQVQVELAGGEKENNAYRGSIECYRTGAGMVIINELPLEEYLYAVVPSEMPASYPAEALKAQAVCARTYGYRYILHAGVPELGAHVDDTTAYQVYHNLPENSATTQAVRETDGMMLSWQEEPAENYYYSTSCGAGTDAHVWSTGDKEAAPYMQAVRLTYSEAGAAETDGSGISVEDLRQEELFRQFITTVWEEDLEKDEPWYRWTYEVEEIDPDTMLSRLQTRYQTAPEFILTKAEGEYYVSEPVERLGEIEEISVAARGAGGVAQELIIRTDQQTYKITGEYNIRYILCDGRSEAVRQDGTGIVPGTLLPSGFFIMETGKRNENVLGYTLVGGGYGHGVGMSQNAARALGEEGTDYRHILNLFFPGCEIGEVHTADGTDVEN